MNVQCFLSHERCPAAFTDLKRSLGTNHKRDRAHRSRLAQGRPTLFAWLPQWRMASRRSCDNRYLLSLAVSLVCIAQAVFSHSQSFSSPARTVAIVAFCELLFSLLYIQPLVRRKPVPSRHSANTFSTALLAMPEVVTALEGTIFPGRGDAIYDNAVSGLRWLLDCAHTPASMLVAGSWAKGLMQERP